MDIMALRWTLVIIVVMVLYRPIILACTFDHLGGPALADGAWTAGCSYGCPAGEPQVHVIAQIAGSDPSTSQANNPDVTQANNTVTVSIQKGCIKPIPIVLVFICVHPIYWVVNYMENSGINPTDIYVFQEYQPYSPSVTLMGVPFTVKGQRLSQQLNLTSDGASVLNLLQNFSIYTIQSISRANYPKRWNLNLPCCDSQQPTLEPKTDTPDMMTIAPGATNTETVAAGKTDANTMTIIIAVSSVVIFVVLVCVLVLAACYFHRQNKKRPAEPAEPNIYTDTPAPRVDNTLVMRDHAPSTSHPEVEYEEAAAVAPPFVPPRIKKQNV